jgi:hypothetical protein
MTDDEKAATFIGWDLNQLCVAPMKPIDGCADWWCAVCNYAGGSRHDTKCPDMSKPENYMRALEARDWYSLDKGDNFRCAVASGDDLISRYSKNSMAAAIVEALAALYDAEHPETEAVPKP